MHRAKRIDAGRGDVQEVEIRVDHRGEALEQRFLRAVNQRRTLVGKSAVRAIPLKVMRMETGDVDFLQCLATKQLFGIYTDGSERVAMCDDGGSEPGCVRERTYEAGGPQWPRSASMPTTASPAPRWRKT